MTLAGALEKLHALGPPVFRSMDAAAVLATTAANASTILARLGRHGHVVRIKRGLWALPGTDPLAVVPHLTAPLPGYVSLQSALYAHGMISQIPDVVFCVSLARTRRYRSALGTVSIHHLPAEMFFGYEASRDGSFSIATPEKALLDFLYLGPAKSRLFAALPELELPTAFSRQRLAAMISRIPDRKRRSYVQSRVEKLLAG
jgi:predicted transcriptional regulator of viral defense system